MRRPRGPRNRDRRAAAAAARRRSGTFSRASADSTAGITRLSSSCSIERSRSDARSGGKRAERVGNRRADAPVAIGLHARQHRDEALLIDRRGGAERRGAHVRPLVGHQVLDRRQSFGARSSPSAATASSRMFGCVAGVAGQPRQRRGRLGAPSCASARIAATVTSSPALAAGSSSASSGLTADGSLSGPALARRTRACSARSCRAVAGARARPACRRCAAARTRPATTPSPAGAREHRRRERLVRLEPHEREQRQLERLGLRRNRPDSSSGCIAATGALVAYSATIRPIAGAAPCGADEAERFAARPRTRGDASVSSGASAASADASPIESERERGHRAHVRIGIGQRRTSAARRPRP